MSSVNNAIKKTTNAIENNTDQSGTKKLDQPINYLDQDYVNEQHVQDFMNALAYDPIKNEHISAWTDALPVRNSKVSKRKLKEQEAANPKGISHFLLQYPLIVKYSILLRMSSSLVTPFSLSLASLCFSNCLPIFH